MENGNEKHRTKEEEKEQRKNNTKPNEIIGQEKDERRKPRRIRKMS